MPARHLLFALAALAGIALAAASLRAQDAPAPPSASTPGAPVIGGLTSPDGLVDVVVNLPVAECKKNIGGSDGAGLCVFTSIEYAARWQGERGLQGFQQFMSKRPGGGYPEKVDQMIAACAPGVEYVQCTSGDVDMLRAALKSGRQPCVTYAGHDPFYGNMTTAHMITLCYCADSDSGWAAVRDNNHPADIVWMSVKEFVRRWMGREFQVWDGRRYVPVGGGWAVILLRPAPPPYPSVPAPPRPQFVAHHQPGPWYPQPYPQPWQPQPFYPPPFLPGPIILPPAPAPEPKPEPGPAAKLRPEEKATSQNEGVESDKIGGLHRWVNGKEATRREVFAALTLPNDGQECWLTVIGAKADRQRVLDDLATKPALAPWKGKIRVQDYDPGEWPVATGFKTDGHPTIYYQDAGGKVLHRQDDYADGAEALASAMRKADPNYDPAKDPDKRKPDPPAPAPQPAPKNPDPKNPEPKQPTPTPPAPEPAKPIEMPAWIWVLVGAGLFLILGARRS